MQIAMPVTAACPDINSRHLHYVALPRDAGMPRTCTSSQAEPPAQHAADIVFMTPPQLLRKDILLHSGAVTDPARSRLKCRAPRHEGSVTDVTFSKLPLSLCYKIKCSLIYLYICLVHRGNIMLLHCA